MDGIRLKAWLWNDALRPAAELDATNAVTARFIYAAGVNVPSPVIKGTNAFHLISDPRGSVRLRGQRADRRDRPAGSITTNLAACCSTPIPAFNPLV
ncbi:MAG: hypothetical protein L0Z50_37730, partial [Verrucomicrobiales bacterium]|nr:hypothetical protein [Verrucomicrobiales bacterium]